MKLVFLSDEPSPAVTELFEQAEERVTRRLGARERRVEAVTAALFVVVAGVIALTMTPARSFSLPIAIALLIGYAMAARVRFAVGAGYTVPTQVLFVPMLLLLPAAIVPLLVASGFLLSELPEYITRKTKPERALLAFGDSWHAIGPALVVTAAGVTQPGWEHWPVYLGALGAQFAVDFVATSARELFALGIRPRAQLAERTWLYLVDTLLAPIGLMAAFSAQAEPYSFLLCLPLAGLLSIFARERTARIQHAVELSQTYRGTAMLLGDVVEADDAYTGSHSRGVVSLALLVAGKLRLDARQMRSVEFAALLHDVGKITIPKEIINKSGPLDDDEWALVQTHTVEGERMLEGVGGELREVGRVVRSCHERWDGKGYPDRLAGTQIPIEARIVNACDAFNAMTTTRPYRKAMTVEFALEELRSCAGTQFDPQVAEVLARLVEEELVREAVPSEPSPSRTRRARKSGGHRDQAELRNTSVRG